MQRISLSVQERSGISRVNEPSSVGIPFAIGKLHDESLLHLEDPNGNDLPLQTNVLSYWPDRSVRWVLISTLLSVPENSNQTLTLRLDSRPRISRLFVTEDPLNSSIRIDSQDLKATLSCSNFLSFRNIQSGENSTAHNLDLSTQLIDANDICFTPTVTEAISSPNNGDVTHSTIYKGSFKSENSQNLNFRSQVEFFSRTSLVKISFTIHNPKPSRHPGGIWDLGDPGSKLFKSLTLKFSLPSQSRIALKQDINGAWIEDSRISLSQLSSGGENFTSNVHKNAKGVVPITHKGYRLETSTNTTEGFRASPFAHIETEKSAINLFVEKFWQNFPKAFNFEKNQFSIELFPEAFGDLFELQGGESKTHTLYLNFDSNKDSLNWLSDPLQLKLPLSYYQSATALPWLQHHSTDLKIDSLIENGIKGPRNFFHKRETIDEFGWRNFGDLYADHEAIDHTGTKPLVSHYNNQYDPLYGFLRQYIITGDNRWYELMIDLANHILDIDIYNTSLDRDEYNFGLFWHTDHYLDADTCTHRTFSHSHAAESYDGHSTGGGPGTEHCYTSGLLYYYLITGDIRAKRAVEKLAEWITISFEGTGSIVEQLYKIKTKELSRIDSVSTKNNAFYFEYPLTRGTGNYISTLLDLFILHGDDRVLANVEQIIQKTSHPNEDLANRDLENIEDTWSYTIFLQSVIKYLQVKASTGKLDSNFEYARGVLKNFGGILLNDTPYLSKPENLEFPNATWIAQDIRKAAILNALIQYNIDPSEDVAAKANYFSKYCGDELSNSDQKELTRILAILMQNHGANVARDNAMSNLPEYKETKLPLPSARKPFLYLKLLWRLIRILTRFSPKADYKWLKFRISA